MALYTLTLQTRPSGNSGDPIGRKPLAEQGEKPVSVSGERREERKIPTKGLVGLPPEQ